MYIHRIFLFMACVFFAGCTLSSIQDSTTYRKTTEELMYEDKSKLYPKFDIEFGSFVVVTAPFQDDVKPTEQLLNAYHKLTVQEKRIMLRHLDTVRFVLNTKEFEDEVLKAKFRASRSGSGPVATIAFGDVYDSKRMIKIMQNRKYKLSIHKDKITKNASAVGVLGEFLYVLDDNDPRFSNSYWIAFPNHDIWSTSGYAREPYMAAVVFHEILHNTGFSHGLERSEDSVYIAQGILENLFKKKEFIEKYQKELEKFRPFYEEKHKEWLLSDTLSYNRSVLVNSQGIMYNGSVGGMEDKLYGDEDYCVLHTDNTHTMYINGVEK